MTTFDADDDPDEPTVAPADLLAGLGSGAPDPVPAVPMDQFLREWGLTAGDLGDDDTGPLRVPIV